MADHIYHLSYGMVELPEGKMKSREGTVVDADDHAREDVQYCKGKLPWSLESWQTWAAGSRRNFSVLSVSEP